MSMLHHRCCCSSAHPNCAFDHQRDRNGQRKQDRSRDPYRALHDRCHDPVVSRRMRRNFRSHEGQAFDQQLAIYSTLHFSLKSSARAPVSQSALSVPGVLQEPRQIEVRIGEVRIEQQSCPVAGYCRLGLAGVL